MDIWAKIKGFGVVLVFGHAESLQHVTPPGHPERAERLLAVERGLAGLKVERRDCPEGAEADVLRCHPAAYLARVKAAVPQAGWSQMDGDTFLAPGSYRAAMRAAWGSVLADIAAWKPELVLVSAGFDAHEDDPLAGLTWQTEDFRWITRAICDLADQSGAGRVVSCLEGGYDLDALATSVAVHVEELGRVT